MFRFLGQATVNSGVQYSVPLGFTPAMGIFFIHEELIYPWNSPLPSLSYSSFLYSSKFIFLTFSSLLFVSWDINKMASARERMCVSEWWQTERDPKFKINISKENVYETSIQSNRPITYSCCVLLSIYVWGWRSRFMHFVSVILHTHSLTT